MAGTSTKSVDEVTLKVMVDKERNKVLYAEAEKDFVDVLLSFLTLPLGTIARLVAKDSNIEAVKLGSISSLYQSVKDLNEKYLWSKTCKEMLLNPRNSMVHYCQEIKLNIDDTHFFGTSGLIYLDNGFVKETATFIIHDDLSVMPNDLVRSLGLLQRNGINNFADVERKILLINKKEVVDLLKLSLFSKTPLTDFILKKKQILCNPILQSKIRIEKSLAYEGNKQMLIKVLVRKSTRNILFAIAEEDFVDFLFSFLTFPLGGVLQMLEGFSSLSSIDMLYKSMTDLSPERCLISQELKNRLCKPHIFHKLEVRNQILPINTKFTYSNKSSREDLELLDPKSSLSGGFARGPLTVMVTDNLVVTPMSSFDGVSYLERMKVPPNDVEEIVINIGVKEGLSILKASLTSTSALTNGLKHYIDSPNVQPEEAKRRKVKL